MTIDLRQDGLSRRLEAPRLRLLSLGAGVQSTVVALMSARGDLEPLDGAIFADTGDEKPEVYEHLDWLRSPGVLPFPVHVVRRGPSLRSAIMNGTQDGERIPWHVAGGGIGGRNCTRSWKIRPIRRKVRELLGARPRGYVAPDSVESWIGITTDEITRIKPSGCTFIHNRHVLVEARMSRQDCYRWLEARQYRVPSRSCCSYCPLQGNGAWRTLCDSPGEWARAVEFDGWLRAPAQQKRFHGEVFLHYSRKPLAEVDLTLADAGPDLFGQECEGMCGV